MNRSNCIKCGSTRSVYSYCTGLKCKSCHAEYFTSTRKKSLFPGAEVQKLLAAADTYRSKTAYSVLTGAIHIDERENIRNTIKGKKLLSRGGRAYLEMRGDGCYFIGLVQIDNGPRKPIEIKTDVSIEEFKLYLASDPNQEKTLSITPHPPYKLYLTFMREKRVSPETGKHIVEVGADVNFPILVAAVRVDGGEPFFVETPFFQHKIMKLQKRENEARASGNLQRQSMLKALASRITKGAYFRFIERVHKEAQRSLGLKTSKAIRYTWRIENPRILRNLHSQFITQGWRPTLLNNCLIEKKRRLYLKIEEINPAYTSVMCNKCGLVNMRNGGALKCECGEVIDWHRNAALNLLKGRRMHIEPTQPCVAGASFTPETLEVCECDFPGLHDKSPLSTSVDVTKGRERVL